MKHIAIEGNIGSGKTTLAKLLAQKTGIEQVLETFENNPFLPKFYTDPGRYALPAELFFLAERFDQLKKITERKETIITDYTLIKSLIFARVTLKADELAVYERLFRMTYPLIPQADLTIYLYNTPDNLLRKIQQRGRPYEKAIDASYLEKIDQSYRQYFKEAARSANMLILDVAGKDFINNPTDLQQVIGMLYLPAG